MQWKRIVTYFIKKVSRKEGDVRKDCKDSVTSIFLECSSMLNASPVTNEFLNYTWLSKCFSSYVFFYILTTFLFYRLFDNVLMKTYSLCGRHGDKKASKETNICGVAVSKWILFIWRFFLLSQKMNWVFYLPFPF